MPIESPAPVVAEPSAPAAPQAPANHLSSLLCSALLIYALYGVTSALRQLLDLPSYTGLLFGAAITLAVLIVALASTRPAPQKAATGAATAAANGSRKLLWLTVGALGFSIILQAAAAFDAYSRGDASTTAASAPRTIVPVDFGKNKKKKKNGDKKGDKDGAKESGDAAGASAGEKDSKKKHDTSTD